MSTRAHASASVCFRRTPPRRGAVDVHADHAPHSIPSSCWRRKRWAARNLRIRARSATGRVAGPASYQRELAAHRTDRPAHASCSQRAPQPGYSHHTRISRISAEPGSPRASCRFPTTLERLNGEVKRRTEVVSIVHNEAAINRTWKPSRAPFRDALTLMLPAAAA
jgi:hypothetical protein